MDLAFHSRVVRKLFHNYKHQLHNIMKYQLSLQKELNLKYQQEKQFKQQIAKLEEDLKYAMNKPPEIQRIEANLRFDETGVGSAKDNRQEDGKKLFDVDRSHRHIEVERTHKETRNLDHPHETRFIFEIKNILSRDYKPDEVGKLKQELQNLIRQLEKEREQLRTLDPNSEEYKALIKSRGGNTRIQIYDVGIMVDFADPDRSQRARRLAGKTF